LLRRCLAPAVFAAALAVTACDSDVSEPFADRDVAALLDGRSVTSYPAHTLPGLLHTAIRTVYTEQGAGAARSLVNDLRRAREQVRARTGLEAAAAAGAAARAEELDIVLRVFGDGIVPATLGAVRAELDRQRTEADGASAADTGRIRELLRAAEQQMTMALTASTEGDSRSALDHAAQAGTLVERAGRARAEALRVPALPELFDAAVARVRMLNGNGDDVRARLARYNELQYAAEQVVRSGERQRAHDALQAAREEQVRFVVDVLGAGAVSRMLASTGMALRELDSELLATRRAGRDVTRLTRMAATARDLLSRANAADRDGDAAAALDLGSHAAGLVNTLRYSLPR
jgi:hypothetical protein